MIRSVEPLPAEVAQDDEEVEDSEAKRSPTGPNPTNTLRLAEFTLRGNCAQNQRRYPKEYPEFRDLIVAAKTAGVLRTSALGTWVGSEWEKLMMTEKYEYMRAMQVC